MTSTFAMGLASFAAAPAYAQPDDDVSEPGVTSEQTPEEAAQQEEGQITVTGSRIQRRDLTSPSPVAVVQDEEFRLSGATNVEQVVNTLPQVIPGSTAFSNNPGGGVATINLRGLGSQRNLVLVNGRRFIFFDAGQVTDINTIPSFLIDSVDVVTGGASAVYGSDALAGVINFRLRNNLEGIIAGAQYNITNEGDGRRSNAYVAIGTQFPDNRGSVTVYAEYLNRGQVFQGAREFSRFALSDNAAGTALVRGGSAGVPEGRIVAVGGPGAPGTVIGAGTNFVGGGAFFIEPGRSVPFTGSASPQGFNYAPSNFLQVPQERWTLGGYADYEITDGVTAFMEVNFINNRVENELAATPLTQQVDFNVAQTCTRVSAADCAQIQTIAARQQAAIAAAAAAGTANPFPAFTAGTGQFGALQPGNVRLQVNTRFTQIANRNVSDDRNAFRALGGFRGGLTDNINYEAYYSYARTRNSSIQEGNVSRSSFTRLAGNGTCNPFGLNQFSDACLAGIGILAQNTDISELQVASANINGSLFTLPWTTEAVGFAVGAEHREVSGQFIPDTALQSGDVVGFNAGQSTEGGYTVREVFGELAIPIVADSFFHRLELNAAGRYSDYSLEAVGAVETYSAGARFAPIRDIEFRGQYQRAVRAPNVAELFGGQSIGFPPATDPCALPSAATNPTVRAICIATGVPAGSVGQPFLQPNTQIQGAFGGNPNLQEEVADTLTFGVVLRPSFIPRLNITLDYYDIDIESAIATAGGGVNGILNLCYNVIQNANSPVCQLISRDTQGIISGPPFVVSAGNANLAALKTSGIDLSVDYSMPLGFSLAGADESRLNFFFLGTYTESNQFIPTVGVDEVIECAGLFGLNCGNPTPEYKWTSRIAWQDGPVTTTVRWRHLDAVTDDDPTTNFIVEEIEAYDLIDLAFAFDVNDNFTLNMGINNLFDTDPPIIGSNQEQANTYPGTYDVLGRDFFVSVNLRF
jgi:outer membrane receptor protein involved in Fe transport